MIQHTGALAVFLRGVSAVELLVSLAVVLVLARRWRRRRSRATAAVLSAYVVLSVVIASGFFAPEEVDGGWAAVYMDVVICVLLLLPYLLARFTWLLGGISARVHRFVLGLLVVELAVTLVLPPLPGPGDPVPWWSVMFTVLVLGTWSTQTYVAARGLWRLSRGESSVVRHRLRTLSAGAVLMAVTIILSGIAGATTPTAFTLTMSVLGLLSVMLYALAFLAPAWLRLLWRQDDLLVLSDAERGLMQALTREDVATTIVPALSRVFGGSGAALLDDDGRPVHLVGTLDLAEASDVRAEFEEIGIDSVRLAGPEALTARLSQGALVVGLGPLSPVVGDDEAALLARVAVMVDLALQRAALFEQEQASRLAAEVANRELETLLYSVSHDLRSPLISVLGYLDVMEREYADSLTGQAPHYLERISVNAVYMQHLITDLLELSRIGRLDPDAEVFDLHALVEDVLEGARGLHPDARLEVVGPLPSVRLSEVRARQLLTNLVDNALTYGGRPDVRITVSSRVDGSDLRLRVADDGQGIPEQYRTRVLRVFERLDAPKSSPGTGIGLAICKRIAESHGGSVSVGGPVGGDSGATIDVTLPGVVCSPGAVPSLRGDRRTAVATREEVTP